MNYLKTYICIKIYTIMATIGKMFVLIFSFIVLNISTFGQTPQAIKYQAVARDAVGNPVANQTVNLRISILQGSILGAVVYSETHSALTNSFGLSNINIGLGTIISGTFSTINWGANTYFIKVEMDINGGASYVEMGTSQLLSVPYALYAENVHTAPGHPHTLSIAGNNLSMTNGNTVTLPTELPAGVSGNTLRYNGAAWVQTNFLHNSGLAIGINNSSPAAMFHLSNGSALWDGTIGNTPVSGAGTRMMWIPSKFAFRAGQVSSNQWDNDSIGAYSAALGANNKAVGAYSFAAGLGCTARGNGASIAMGWNSQSTGGSGSFATGYDNLASGLYSFASGHGTIASGSGGYTAGVNTTASGDYAFASGSNSTARAFASMVIGRYNVISGSTSSWNDAEPVFVIGNGTSSILTSNALTVLKDARMGISSSSPIAKLDIRNDLVDKTMYLANNYTGAGTKYGIYNSLSQDGTGTKYGIYSAVVANTADNSTNYGVYSYINSNSTIGNEYGFYAYLSNSGTGNHYGVYSYAPGGWSGYFSSGDMYVADNMGIGTTTIPAGYKFAVNGKGICEELNVQLNADWPDYVFNPEYKLPSLSSLESDILELGHLPEMPSAQEVKEQGLGVGEISRQLTKKVEELTLYLINLNKKVEALQQENSELKAMIHH